MLVLEWISNISVEVKKCINFVMYLVHICSILMVTHLINIKAYFVYFGEVHKYPPEC